MLLIHRDRRGSEKSMRLLSFEKVSPELLSYLMYFSLQIVLSA